MFADGVFPSGVDGSRTTAGVSYTVEPPVEQHVEQHGSNKRCIITTLVAIAAIGCIVFGVLALSSSALGLSISAKITIPLGITFISLGSIALFSLSSFVCLQCLRSNTGKTIRY